MGRARFDLSRCAALALVFLVPACGASGGDESACSLVDRAAVLDALNEAGGETSSIRRSSDESLHRSVCHYSGSGTNIGLTLDTAPEVRRRYFNRVTEQELVSVHRAAARPRPVQGIGDENAYGPAGAYWIPASRQLFALRGERLLIVQFSARRVDVERSRAAAEQLARAALGRPVVADAPGPGRGSPVRLELAIIAPAGGEVVRTASVTVQGTVTGRGARVEVAGRPTRLRNGIFARSVRLRRGANQIDVVAAAAPSQRRRMALTVRRGRSARQVGSAFARAQPGRVPDVQGELLGVAEAILDHADIRHRRVKLDEGMVSPTTWAVCLTRPHPGVRLQPGRRVVLLIDHADVYRSSGTGCAQN